MSKSGNSILFDASVRLDNLPAEGRTLSINADADQLQALAELMRVSSVDAFGAELKAEKLRGGIHVTGELTATVAQPCVVTFEPVVQVIHEPVDRVFLNSDDREHDSTPGSETFVDLEADDIPDHFTGLALDLTPLILEVLALSIDLYPRAPGAQVPGDVDDGEISDPGPFAALEALKTNESGNS